MQKSCRHLLGDLCRRFRVRRLYLFGSAAKGNFQPDASGLDFLVILAPDPPATYAEAYLGLAQSLEELFERRVDLVTEPSIRNPYLRQAIDATREFLYDAGGEDAVA